MPKMGESIIEATITKWLKSAGDKIIEDESIAEIATDKVDSEIPSQVEGVITEIFYKEGDVVPVGKVIAAIELNEGGAAESSSSGNSKGKIAAESSGSGKTAAESSGGGSSSSNTAAESSSSSSAGNEAENQTSEVSIDRQGNVVQPMESSAAERFYSPLVRSIAKQENISLKELELITGTGIEGRITKRDILDYLQHRQLGDVEQAGQQSVSRPGMTKGPDLQQSPKAVRESGDEVFEMDRVRKLIADHMVMSKNVSAHVTSFIDVDVTAIVHWRDKVKEAFLEREKEKLTYTPIFIEAAAQVIREFPRVNASVDGTNIIHHKRINIGMATALPNGNLIVPVIKNVDQMSLLGLVKNVNDLANRARNNNLIPDEIQGGTFTVTNFGTFDSLTGTPIINQPQVAILGIGAIRKQPVVLENSMGDIIAIRSIMILSLTYDHRIVDGALGGMFLKRLKQVLENWDISRSL